MKYSVVTFVIVFVLLLSACQTTKQYLSTFHGKERSYVLGHLGPPDFKESNDKGGEIWIYQEKSITVSPAKVETSFEHDSSDSNKKTKKTKVTPLIRRIYIDIKSFYINKDKIIYDTAHGSRITEE